MGFSISCVLVGLCYAEFMLHWAGRSKTRMRWSVRTLCVQVFAVVTRAVGCDCTGELDRLGNDGVINGELFSHDGESNCRRQRPVSVFPALLSMSIELTRNTPWRASDHRLRCIRILRLSVYC